MHETADITLYAGSRAESVRVYPQEAALQLDDGGHLTRSLPVVADSRFSETRRALGVDADLHDFSKSMLVCRMRHEADNEQAA